MASTAAGVAVGSSIGHAIGGFFGGGGSSSSGVEAGQTNAATTPQEENTTTTTSYNNAFGARSCDADAKSLAKCLDEHQGNMSICGWYLEQFKACQSAASQY
jgi:hypothetical protein